MATIDVIKPPVPEIMVQLTMTKREAIELRDILYALNNEEIKKLIGRDPLDGYTLHNNTLDYTIWSALDDLKLGYHDAIK